MNFDRFVILTHAYWFHMSVISCTATAQLKLKIYMQQWVLVWREKLLFAEPAQQLFYLYNPEKGWAAVKLF